MKKIKARSIVGIAILILLVSVDDRSRRGHDGAPFVRIETCGNVFCAGPLGPVTGNQEERVRQRFPNAASLIGPGRAANDTER